MKICHLALTHDVLQDSRIMSRMACSAADEGHQVTIISSGINNTKIGNVMIKTVSKKNLNRIFYPYLWASCLYASLKEKADVYHIHEVPLMLCGLILKLIGKSVVIDFHEDFEAELFEKPHLNRFFMWTFYFFYQPFKWILIPIYDFIILSEEDYKKNFHHVKSKINVVKNHPRVKQFKFTESTSEDEFKLIYIGAITEDRGCRNLIEAVNEIKLNKTMNISLTLTGRIPDKSFKDFVEKEQFQSSGFIKWTGPRPFTEIQRVLTKFSLGFAALHNNPNYRTSLPTKILEYNAAGLMCIASDLPITHKYVVQNFNGQIVRPNKTSEIAKSIIDIYENNRYKQKLKIRDWVMKEFSWEKEFSILKDVYSKVYK